MWFVYIVRCSDRTLYTGVTTDAEKRVAAHNRGRGARYTRSRLPVVLVYVEPAADRSAALRREREIKRMDAAVKRRMIAGRHHAGRYRRRTSRRVKTASPASRR